MNKRYQLVGLQISRIRRALKDYRKEQSKLHGMYSWPRVVGDILVETDFDVGPFVSGEQEKRALKSLAEWTKRFCSQRSGATDYRSRTPFIEAISDFCVAKLLLHESELYWTDVDLSLAFRLASLFSTGPRAGDQEEVESSELVGLVGLDGVVSHIQIERMPTETQSVYLMSAKVFQAFTVRGNCKYLYFTGFSVGVNKSQSVYYLNENTTGHSIFRIFESIDRPVDGGESKFLKSRNHPFPRNLEEGSIGEDFVDLANILANPFSNLPISNLIVDEARSADLLEHLPRGESLEKIAYFKDLYYNSRVIQSHNLVDDRKRRRYLQDEEGLDASLRLLKFVKVSVEDTEGIKLLIDAGARLDVIDDVSGMNALHLIAYQGNRPALRLALEFKDRCDFSQRDRLNRTAGCLAEVYADDPAMARILDYVESRTFSDSGEPEISP